MAEAAASGERIKQVHAYIDAELRNPKGLREFTLSGIAKALGISTPSSCQYPVRKLVDAEALSLSKAGKPGAEAIYRATEQGIEYAQGGALEPPDVKPKRAAPHFTPAALMLKIPTAKRGVYLEMTLDDARKLYSQLAQIFKGK